MYEARLLAARTLSPTVRELTLDAGPGFQFVPGQWVSLRLPQPNGEQIARAYSIASAPRDDGRFDLAITRVHGGPGSEFLHTIEPGAILRIARAQGLFTLEPVTRPILMVATGTGVSPLRSMLQTLAKVPPARAQPCTLLFGCRTEADVLYATEFHALTSAWPKFRFEPTLSRAESKWPGRTGYVQLHVPELVHALGDDCDVYICGLGKMVREVRAVLKDQLGFARGRVHTERYD